MKTLIVEDTPSASIIMCALATAVTGEAAEAAHNGNAALERLTQSNYDLVVTDQNIPGLCGLELTRAVRQMPKYQGVPVVMVTGTVDSDMRKQAVSAGVTDFIPKPIEPVEFKTRIKNLSLIRQSFLTADSRRELMEHRALGATRELEVREREVMQCLLRVLQFRDDDTGQHVARMARLSAMIARELGLDEETQHMIEFAAPLHDIGKIGVPDAILNKAGPLTDEERIWIKEHVRIGVNILDEVKSASMRMARSIAMHHHEHFDGSGYPYGLVGTNIPLEGRITAVADVFDALTSDRVYRKAMSVEPALLQIARSSGRQFDPQCVDALFRLHPRLGDLTKIGDETGTSI